MEEITSANEVEGSYVFAHIVAEYHKIFNIVIKNHYGDNREGTLLSFG